MSITKSVGGKKTQPQAVQGNGSSTSASNTDIPAEIAMNTVLSLAQDLGGLVAVSPEGELVLVFRKWGLNERGEAFQR